MINFLFTKTPLVFVTQSLWRDEAFSYLIAKKSFVDIAPFAARDFNPPLYYFILHFWIKLFGVSEIALRSLSVVFFWATIFIVYLILTDLFKFTTKKGYVFLIFFIFNPLLLYYAFEVRMYSLFAFLATLSFYSFYQNKRRLYIVATVLGLYTHFFMIFVIACQFLYLLMIKRRKSPGIVTLQTMIFPVLFFIPWLFFIYGKIPLSNATWVPFVKPVEIFNLVAVIFTGYEKDSHYLKTFDNGFTPILFSVSFIVISLVLWGLARLNKKNNKKILKLFWYLMIWGCIPPLFIFLITLFRPLYVPRYLIFSTVGLVLLLILSLQQLPKIVRYVAISLFVCSLIYFLVLKSTHQTKANLRKVVGEIKKLAGRKDFLYVRSELDFFVAQYYFDENRVYIYGKTYQEIPDYIGKVLIPRERIAARLPRYPQKAFILKPDETYEIQALY